MLAVMSSDKSVATPGKIVVSVVYQCTIVSVFIGMDNINVTTNNDHRRALYHLIEW